MQIRVSTLRLAWAIVEATPIVDLLHLPDALLLKSLLQQIAAQTLLSEEEAYALSGYFGSRLRLVRDLAESRLELRSAS